jgi:hypothetical protein
MEATKLGQLFVSPGFISRSKTSPTVRTFELPDQSTVIKYSSDLQMSALTCTWDDVQFRIVDLVAKSVSVHAIIAAVSLCRTIPLSRQVSVRG